MKPLAVRCIALLVCLYPMSLAALEMPLRELVRISSWRENQVVGYGLVVGLPGSGDSQSEMARSSLKKVLSHRGIEIGRDQMQGENIAAVMVMGKVPPHARSGDEIDVWVSSIGDADSLKGGYLIQTPLKGADGETYAVAQASMAMGKEADNFNRQKSATTIRIPNGAVMEKPVVQPFPLKEVEAGENRVFKLTLRNFEVGTVRNILDKINEIAPNSARLVEDGTIELTVPEGQQPLNFLARIYDLEVEVENPARVVIDPRSGTIVMGGKVGLSEASVTKKGITVEIKPEEGENQALYGERDKKVSSMHLPEAPTVGALVDSLTQLGLEADDIIDIVKALHRAGALHAELVVL